MTRIFGWLCDHSGCGYYRVKLPFNVLKNRGLDVRYEGSMPTDVALGGVDTVLAQRVVLPGPTEWIKRAVTRGTCRVVVELDDDLFSIEPTNPIAFQFFDREKQDRAREVLAVADHVTVTTDHLANVLSEHTRAPIEVVPNHVSAWLLDHEPPRRTDGVVTVGYAGSATHVGDWAELSGELRRFLTRTENVELHLMGHNLAEKWPKVRHSGWHEEIDAYLAAIDFHVGLAPLRPSLFNRSKSALKAMEYGALGIPVIASDVGPYSDYVLHGETGFLVRRPHEWSVYLRELVSDPELRAAMGRRAREHVRRTSIIEDNAWRWEKVLTG